MVDVFKLEFWTQLFYSDIWGRSKHKNVKNSGIIALGEKNPVFLHPRFSAEIWQTIKVASKVLWFLPCRYHHLPRQVHQNPQLWPTKPLKPTQLLKFFFNRIVKSRWNSSYCLKLTLSLRHCLWCNHRCWRWGRRLSDNKTGGLWGHRCSGCNRLLLDILLRIVWPVKVWIRSLALIINGLSILVVVGVLAISWGHSQAEGKDYLDSKYL